jgi:hypothetical protein
MAKDYNQFLGSYFHIVVGSPKGNCWLLVSINLSIKQLHL